MPLLKEELRAESPWTNPSAWHDRSMPLLKEELALRTDELGPDHPDTLTSMNDLAVSYAWAGQLDRALPLFEEVLALRKEKLGDDHPDTLTTLSGPRNGLQLRRPVRTVLAASRGYPGAPEGEAGPGPSRYPRNHEQARRSRYRDSDRLEKALPLLEQTLAFRKAKLGPGHPDTLTSMTNLAEGYQAAGQLGRPGRCMRKSRSSGNARPGPIRGAMPSPWPRPAGACSRSSGGPRPNRSSAKL